MPVSPLAGKPAPPELLIDVDRLIRDYYERTPDLSDPQQMVAFGTSGHRGSPCADSVIRDGVLYAHRRGGDSKAEGEAGATVARGCEAAEFGPRADYSKYHWRSWK